MFGLIMCVFDMKKEFLVGISLSILYITYYLVEVVKRPVVVCGWEALRGALEEGVPLLSERYWPTPWCVEARLQTVLGSLLRSHCLPAPPFRREVVVLSDGGQVALDWAPPPGGAPAGSAVLLILPGLTGGAHADYVRCLCAAAHQLGATAVVFNNRGLGGMPLTSPRLYCAVSHEDLAEAVAAVRGRAGAGAPLLAAGVSLGGLILGHYLASRGAAAPLHAALIISSPLDVHKSVESIERWPLNALLSAHMARSLRRTVTAHAAALRRRPAGAGVVAGAGAGAGAGAPPPACDWAGVRASRTVRQFDAAFTAPHFGFKSTDEYYSAATLADKLHRVRVPTLCLQAADDPFQPAHTLPWAAAAARGSRVALCVPARGGHIGFLEGWWPARAAHDQYMARLAAQYFGAMLRRPHLAPPAPAPQPGDTAPADAS